MEIEGRDWGGRMVSDRRGEKGERMVGEKRRRWGKAERWVIQRVAMGESREKRRGKESGTSQR